ncbi:MAG: hypothetical protein FKGGLIKP_00315 [Sodalis sp. Fse]|nr:MAG: hypothetical protein FKGGLIKP_00315 [Sodalis sp. Fse]
MNNAIVQQIAEQGGIEAYLHVQQHKVCCVFLFEVAWMMVKAL